MVGAALDAPRAQARRARRSTSTLARDLPLVSVDPVLFEQVFVNLLENAAKYTPAGSPIEIARARATDARRDRGRATAGRACRRDARSASSRSSIAARTPASAASGSGLRSAARSSRRTAARIARREPRRAAARVFRIALPLAGDAAVAAARARGARMSERRPLVLVVEDEPQMRRFLRASLAVARLPAARGGDARAKRVALATSHNPELVLLDLGLPDGDGIELTRAAARVDRSAPIIVISARGREDDKVARARRRRRRLPDQAVRRERAARAHARRAAPRAARDRRRRSRCSSSARCASTSRAAR